MTLFKLTTKEDILNNQKCVINEIIQATRLKYISIYARDNRINVLTIDGFIEGMEAFIESRYVWIVEPSELNNTLEPDPNFYSTIRSYTLILRLDLFEVSTFEYLESQGINLEARGGFTLRFAVKHNLPILVKFLLEKSILDSVIENKTSSSQDIAYFYF